MANINDVVKLVNALQPIIWIDSYEERRVIKDIITSDIIGLDEKEDSKGKIQQYIKEDKLLYIWSATQGLVEVEQDEWQNLDELQTKDNTTIQPVGAIQHIREKKVEYSVHKRLVVIMRDFHQMCNIPPPGRKLRDLFRHFARYKKTVILIGPSSNIPIELQKDVYLLRYDLPDHETIKTIINDAISHISSRKSAKKDPKDNKYITTKIDNKTRRFKVEYSDEEIISFVRASQGLTKLEILCAVSKSIQTSDNGEISFEDLAKEKQNIIKKSEVLEYWTHIDPMEDVGGNDILKKWLSERSHAITGNAVSFGVRSPKGVLITGVQGCGKSMLAKATASELKIPLIRLDMGKVFAGLVGSSEKNMRDAISQAEAMSPCVLWLDEIEKGLSGTGSSNFSDGGTSSRVFGTLVTWLNEKTKPVFVVATANDISQLPPELFRKGRFDGIWFVDLPLAKERDSILKIHIARIGRDPKKFKTQYLSELRYKCPTGKSYDYSGSEIEEAINDALFSVYTKNPKAQKCKKGDITTKDIEKALEQTIPISCTASSKVSKIREWGRKHARFASSLSEKESKEDDSSKTDINEITKEALFD